MKLEINNENKNFIKSIGVNTVLKPISMVFTFLYTPVLLSFLGDSLYGSWITVLSIINWINYFDIGIGNGTRNLLTEELYGKSDRNKINEIISTSYITISLIVFTIFSVLFLILEICNIYEIEIINREILIPLIISLIFMCINFILMTINNIYYALQKSELVSVANIAIQIINLFMLIFIQNINFTSNKLISVSIVFGLSSFLIYSFLSIKLWNKYKYLKPKINSFNKIYVKNVLNIGIRFFIIQICALILYSTDNVIVNYLYSSLYVTPYSTAVKFFSVFYSIFAAMLTPIWSRATIAKKEHDYSWFINIYRKIVLLWILFSIAIVSIIPFYKKISFFWLKEELNYDKGLIVCVAIYYVTYMYSAICSSLINGTGFINTQMKISVFNAVVFIPLSIFLAKVLNFKTAGVCLAKIIVTLICDVILTIQLKELIVNKKL